MAREKINEYNLKRLVVIDVNIKVAKLAKSVEFSLPFGRTMTPTEESNHRMVKKIGDLLDKEPEIVPMHLPAEDPLLIERDDEEFKRHKERLDRQAVKAF